jgi:putative transposase
MSKCPVLFGERLWIGGWRQRYGKANEHNSRIPRDSWLEDWEKQAILDFYKKHSDEGYRRLTSSIKNQEPPSQQRRSYQS